MPGILNERIAALRKEQGLTQEQLGQLVGVSSQAVSKWEKGGAPDVELLPTLASQLGVTIDALFGIEGGERIDLVDAARRWLTAIPKGQRLDQMCRLVWQIMEAADLDSPNQLNLVADMSYAPVCESEISGDSSTPRWLKCGRIWLEEGLVLGVPANDMSFISIWPEPKRGWEPFLEDNWRYRRLFALLAEPNCLELLEYLHSRPRFSDRYTPGAIAKAMALETAEVDRLMSGLAQLGLLRNMDVETGSGMIQAYHLTSDEALVPLLYFARWIMAVGRGFWNKPVRSTPILRGEKWKEKTK